MRGISGVVIAVLLTVIGIVAVLAFWAMFSGLFNPQPKVVIEKATLTRIGNNQYDLSISIREVGGASTTIQRVVLTGGGYTDERQCNLKGTQDTSLQAGQSKQLVYQCDLSLNPGTTYYVRVYYQKGTGTDGEATDLYPVTVR